MYLKQPARFGRYQHQQGSTLALALFVIVLISALVLGLLSQQLSTSTAISYEVQGNRAFNAAQSGLQRALVQLYPLSGSATCAAVNANINFSGAGLTDCRATISCTTVTNPLDTSRPLYRLQSSGTCSANEITTSRVVTMDAY